VNIFLISLEAYIYNQLQHPIISIPLFITLAGVIAYFLPIPPASQDSKKRKRIASLVVIGAGVISFPALWLYIQPN